MNLEEVGYVAPMTIDRLKYKLVEEGSSLEAHKSYVAEP
jgi:hypothetical protein